MLSHFYTLLLTNIEPLTNQLHSKSTSEPVETIKIIKEHDDLSPSSSGSGIGSLGSLPGQNISNINPNLNLNSSGKFTAIGTGTSTSSAGV